MKSFKRIIQGDTSSICYNGIVHTVYSEVHWYLRQDIHVVVKNELNTIFFDRLKSHIDEIR